MDDIRSAESVRALFDEMARTYGVVNLVSSLGFAYFWRRSCVAAVRGEAATVCDLMAGGGECLPHLEREFGRGVQVDLVDWSTEMCKRAESTVARSGRTGARVLNCNALALPCPNHSYDVVVSTFGLKTLKEEELAELAKEVKRVLRPGGRFAFLEFSVPERVVVRQFFRAYVEWWVPFLGAVFLGNPDNYRMLWRYTSSFGNCRRALPRFQQCGLETQYSSYFMGSATQLSGRAPGPGLG